MSSLDRWAEDFTRAIVGYRKAATSKLISYDSGRLYTYMTRHPSDFPDVIQYIEADQWGTMRMKDLISKYLRFRGINHHIEMVSESRNAGGALYAKPSAAIFKE